MPKRTRVCANDTRSCGRSSVDCGCCWTTGSGSRRGFAPDATAKCAVNRERIADVDRRHPSYCQDYRESGRDSHRRRIPLGSVLPSVA